jgi:hypothetical protein
MCSILGMVIVGGGGLGAAATARACEVYRKELRSKKNSLENTVAVIVSAVVLVLMTLV